MPAKCRFCENNTHSGDDPVCERLFLTPPEAYDMLVIDNDNVHVFIATGMGVIVGADWSVDSIKDLLSKSPGIEIADPEGIARAMKHGVCVAINDNAQENHFLQAHEDKLKAFEEVYRKEIVVSGN